MNMQRHFLLLATVAAITLASAQQFAPTAAPPILARKAPSPSRISPAYGVTATFPGSYRRHLVRVRSEICRAKRGLA